MVVEARVTSVWSSGMRKLYLVIIIAFINSANNGYDGSMVGALSSFKEYNDYFGLLTNGIGVSAGVINSVLSLGGMLGALAAGPFTDFRGRRMGMSIGCAIVVVGAILQCTTTSYAQFVVGRFIVGFGIPITVTAAPVWVTELAPPQLRGTLVGIYNCFWFVGSSFALATTLGVEGYPPGSDFKWRVPLGCQGLPSLFVLLTVWFLPESPRWLIAHGREEEGVEILARYHADGDKSAAIVQEQKQEIVERIEEEQRLKNSGSFIQLVNSRPALHRLLICFIIAMFPGGGLLSYYYVDLLANAGITDSTTQLTLQWTNQTLSFIFAILGALWLTERWGRRPMGIFNTGVTVLGYIVITALTGVGLASPSVGATIGVVVALWVTGFAGSATWTPLQALYPSEIQDYVTRGKAVGVTQFFFQLNGLIFNFANAVGLANLSWKYYIIIGVLNLFWFIAVYFSFVETKGRSLEEVGILFQSATPIKDSKKPPIGVVATEKDVEQ